MHSSVNMQVIRPVKVVLQDYYQQTVVTASGWLCEVSAVGAGISSLSGGKAVTANGTATFQDLIVAGEMELVETASQGNMKESAVRCHASMCM